MKIKNCGIYQIVNIVNGKRYIGSSSNLASRKIGHFRDLEKKQHYNISLQRACNKYGIDKLKFEIIKYCKRENLLIHEQKFIDKYNKKDFYNHCMIAGSTLGIKHSDKANKEKSIRQTGHGTSQETREKIRQSLLGKKHTPERRKNLSIAHIGKQTGWDHPGIRPIMQLDIKTNKIIKFWIGAQQVEKELNIKHTNISKVCNNIYGRKSAGGFKWRFATKKEIEYYKKLLFSSLEK